MGFRIVIFRNGVTYTLFRYLHVNLISIYSIRLCTQIFYYILRTLTLAYALLFMDVPV